MTTRRSRSGRQVRSDAAARGSRRCAPASRSSARRRRARSRAGCRTRCPARAPDAGEAVELAQAGEARRQVLAGGEGGQHADAPPRRARIGGRPGAADRHNRTMTKRERRSPRRRGSSGIVDVRRLAGRDVDARAVRGAPRRRAARRRAGVRATRRAPMLRSRERRCDALSPSRTRRGTSPRERGAGSARRGDRQVDSGQQHHAAGRPHVEPGPPRAARRARRRPRPRATNASRDRPSAPPRSGPGSAGGPSRARRRRERPPARLRGAVGCGDARSGRPSSGRGRA